MRVLLKGVHKVRYRLVSGELATYYYAWRSGLRIYAEPAPTRRVDHEGADRRIVIGTGKAMAAAI